MPFTPHIYALIIDYKPEFARICVLVRIKLCFLYFFKFFFYFFLLPAKLII